MQIMRPVAFSMLAVACLAACQPEQSYPDTSGRAPDCGAQALQSLVGQPLRQFHSAPADRPTQSPAPRVIGPDTAVTMDYVPNRLNVEHDGRLIITRIYCG